MAEERALEQKLVKAVKSKGGLALKFVSPNYAGVPDRLILIAYGHIGFVEVKALNQKPRKLQEARIRKLRQMGFKVFVLDKESQIGGILNDIQSA